MTLGGGREVGHKADLSTLVEDKLFDAALGAPAVLASGWGAVTGQVQGV